MEPGVRESMMWAFVTFAMIVVGCRADDEVDRGKFSWRGDPSNPEEVVYTLDGRTLGIGDAGLLAFEEIVRHSTPGTHFYIGIYYSPAEPLPRRYPFSGNPIWDRTYHMAEQRDIDILYPGLLLDAPE